MTKPPGDRKPARLVDAPTGAEELRLAPEPLDARTKPRGERDRVEPLPGPDRRRLIDGLRHRGGSVPR